LDIQLEQRQENLIISFLGSLDALTADQAHRFVGQQLDGGHRQIVIDLGKVDFMSSAGIRVLLDMLKRSRGMGGDLRLAATQPGVQRTLEVSGMVRVLRVYPSAEEAVRSYELQEP
jgi:anti-anti-sigma factor